VLLQRSVLSEYMVSEYRCGHRCIAAVRIEHQVAPGTGAGVAERQDVGAHRDSPHGARPTLSRTLAMHADFGRPGRAAGFLAPVPVAACPPWPGQEDACLVSPRRPCPTGHAGWKQPFSCAAGEGLLRQVPAAPSGKSPSPAQREKGFLPNSRREVRDQPFSCEAGEGGAKRRMRARAQRAAVALPGNIKSTRRCARAPSSALRAPSPVNGRRASSVPCLVARVGTQPFSCEAGEGLPSQLSPQGSDPALLLRSGRRWREAPDEGASAASCCCSSQAKSRGTLPWPRGSSSAL